MTRTDLPSHATAHQKLARLAVRSLAGAAVFAAGYVSAFSGSLFATSINLGLLNAFDSVGKNLFGEAVFSASLPSQFVPGNPVRIEVATDSRISAALGVFVPGNPVVPTDPCRRIAQLVVTPSSLSSEVGPSVQFYYDPETVTAYPLNHYQIAPGQSAPNVARCTAVPSPTF